MNIPHGKTINYICTEYLELYNSTQKTLVSHFFMQYHKIFDVKNFIMKHLIDNLEDNLLKSCCILFEADHEDSFNKCLLGFRHSIFSYIRVKQIDISQMPEVLNLIKDCEPISNLHIETCMYMGISGR